jgi:extradiol dioxygenase family protein
MTISPSVTAKKLKIGQLRKVHHIAFNVKDMEASRHFYGEILGLEELMGEKIPSTLKPTFRRLKNTKEKTEKVEQSTKHKYSRKS